MGRAPGASLLDDPDCGGVAAAHYEDWARLDQCVIDNAAKQWRKRIRACVAANSGHFEHLNVVQLLLLMLSFIVT